VTPGKPGPSGPLPYLEITQDGYAEQAARTFSIEEAEPGDYVLRGPCPRCGAVVDIPVVAGIFDGSRSLAHRPQPGDGGKFTEPVICTCEDDHPNRPPERFGCGAYWNFVIVPASR
jgi:hypothetical protein